MREWKWKATAKRNSATIKTAASRDPERSPRQARPARSRPIRRWSDVRDAPEGMDEAPPGAVWAWADPEPRKLAAAPKPGPKERATRRAWVELTARLIDDRLIDGVELIQRDRESRAIFSKLGKNGAEPRLPYARLSASAMA